MPASRNTLTAVAVALSLLAGGAMAKMSAEDVARLGKDLNPIGGIRAGSADGLLPEWTGNIVGLPPGIKWVRHGKIDPVIVAGLAQISSAGAAM